MYYLFATQKVFRNNSSCEVRSFTDPPTNCTHYLSIMNWRVVMSFTISTHSMFGSSLPSLFVGGLCFIYVICVCLRIVVSNTYCAVFLFVFSRLVFVCVSSSCVPYVASFLDCPFLISPLVFSNVYLGGDYK